MALPSAMQNMNRRRCHGPSPVFAIAVATGIILPYPARKASRMDPVMHYTPPEIIISAKLKVSLFLNLNHTRFGIYENFSPFIHYPAF